MGTGHLNKAQLEQRKQFDAEVHHLAREGLEKEEIAILLGCNKNKVTFALHRAEHGVSSSRLPHNSETEAREEAELLIDAKLAPVIKPKAKLVEVNGWENGKYVHYTAWDVSEFWGL